MTYAVVTCGFSGQRLVQIEQASVFEQSINQDFLLLSFELFIYFQQFDVVVFKLFCIFDVS